jgi:crossover junction endodeoxyribonuclease RuvC
LITLGVDPGLKGGVAALDGEGRLLWAEPLPMLDGLVDPSALRALLSRLGGDPTRLFAYVERAQAFPGQGISSTFKYGVGYGSLLSALAWQGIGYQAVPAGAWKRAMGLTGDKADSIAMARRYWPQLALRRKDDGLAEAALLARWGWRKDGGLGQQEPGRASIA